MPAGIPHQRIRGFGSRIGSSIFEFNKNFEIQKEMKDPKLFKKVLWLFISLGR